MRMIIAALSLISVTFAGTTAYFARELQLERERERSRALPAVIQVSPTAPALLIRPPSASPAPAPQQAKTPRPVEFEDDEAFLKQSQAEHSRRLMKALENPEQRKEMLIEFGIMLRNSYPRLAQALRLSSEETERLYELLALQQLDSLERSARCSLDANCSFRDMGRPESDARHQEIANFLGGERQQQFEAYKDTLMERESVVQLRNRLSDANRLPDDKAEALITALADERQKMHWEAAQRGTGMNGHGTGVGMIFSAADAPTPEASLESAQANSRRLRERAAAVLTAEQLRVFNEMQDELLISMRQQLRFKQDFATDASAPPIAIAN